jgi:hypothetical protein
MRCGAPPIAERSAAVGTDPIADRLRPGRLDESEVRGAHHRDEDLRPAHLAGQPVDDHRDRVVRTTIRFGAAGLSWPLPEDMTDA